jgi:[ribosomal protein S18]-alanine N-acetyltransferase
VGFALRDFRQEDFEALWQIDQQCFVSGIAYSRAELAAYIRREGSFTVVAQPVSAEGEARRSSRVPFTSSSAVVGFIIAEVNRRGIGHIISIDVAPVFRRSGLGSKLLGAAEDRLKRSACRAVVLETAVDNGAAVAFYKRHHYGVVQIVPRYYVNGVDALIFEKKLAPKVDTRKDQGEG